MGWKELGEDGEVWSLSACCWYLASQAIKCWVPLDWGSSRWGLDMRYDAVFNKDCTIVSN